MSSRGSTLYGILVLIAYGLKSLINANADGSSKARGLNFGVSLHLQPYLCMQACSSKALASCPSLCCLLMQ